MTWLKQLFCAHGDTLTVVDDWGTATRCGRCGKAWVTWANNPDSSLPRKSPMWRATNVWGKP